MRSPTHNPSMTLMSGCLDFSSYREQPFLPQTLAFKNLTDKFPLSFEKTPKQVSRKSMTANKENIKSEKTSRNKILSPHHKSKATLGKNHQKQSEILSTAAA